MTAESAAPPAKHPALGFRLWGMMFLQWAMIGVWVPLVGRFALAGVDEGGLGFTQGQYGWMTGLSAAVGALLAPFIGGQIADRRLPAQWVLAGLLAVGGVLQCITATQTAYVAWLYLGIATSIAFGPTGALSNSLALAHMENPSRQFPWVRIGGTIGWIVPAWVFPMVWLQKGLEFTWRPPFLVGVQCADITKRLIDSYYAGAILAFVYAAYCLTLPHTPPQRDARARLAVGKALRLFRHRSFAVLVVAGILISAIHNIYFAQTSQFLKVQGLREADLLPAMSIGQIAEIGVMAATGWLLSRLGFRAVLTIGATSYVLRFLFFGTTGLPLWLLVGSQALHGVGFACFLATAFIYIDRIAEPDIRHSTQTLFAIFLAIGPILAGALTGPLTGLFTTMKIKMVTYPLFLKLPAVVDELNYSGFFYVLAAIGLVATAIVALLFRDETAKSPPHAIESAP